MTREDIENNVGYWQEKANLEYVNQCLERGVTDFTETDRAFDAGFDKGYQYAVGKACEWLESMSGYVVCGQKANVNNFRKAMQ